MTGLLVVAGIAVAIALEVAASPRGFARTPATAGTSLLALAAAASLLLLAASVVAVWTADSVPLAVAGATSVAGGGWLRAAAMRNLGAGFRTEAGADTLITSGIHASMRHPSELGFVAWTLGLLIASPGWLALGLALLQLPLLALRLRIEESALAARFGSAWTAYAERTPRFLV